MRGVNFYLKKPEPRTGLSLIYLQVKYSGRKLVYSFGQTIDPKNWNSAKQRVKNNQQTTSDGDHSLNELLDELEAVCLKGYKTELKNGIPDPSRIRPYLDDFLNRNKPDSEPSINLYNLIDRFIRGEIKRNGKEKSRGSINNYRTVKLHLQAFQKKHHYTVNFDTVTLDFFYKYVSFLRNEVKLAHNSIAKDISILKVFMGEAVDFGLTTNFQFRNRKFSFNEVEVESVYLTEPEILKLYEADFSGNKKLEGVRDLFVFGCFVGLRFSDFSDINPANIFSDENVKYLKVKTKKTGEDVIVPCHPIVLTIFRKYTTTTNHLPKAISNQKFNEYLKEVCRVAGFTEKGRLISQPEKELCELVSSHTARRSFATNFYLQGFPTLDLMRITGHKTEKAFLKYIKVSKLDTAKRLNQHINKRWSVSHLRVSA